MVYRLQHVQGTQLLHKVERLLQQDQLARSATAAQLEARRWSLATFTQRAWAVLEPSARLEWNFHLTAMCDHIEALLLGRLAHNNLSIEVPPGSGKSRVASVMSLAWMWTRRPSFRAIFGSANPRTSTRDSLLTRALITSPWYRQTFGIAWDLADDQDTKLLFNNSAGGWRQATTTGARVTGDRADLIALDDALDAADAFSSAAREQLITWWTQGYANRLSDLRSGKRLVIGQRLHEQDLVGWLAANEPRSWERLTIPMLYEPQRKCVTSLWSDPRTEENQLMFPVRFPQSVVDAERVRLGRSGFDGQMQQRPSAAEGEIFRRGHLQLLPADQLPACKQTIISLDTAYSEKQTADYSAAVVLGQHDRGFTVLDVVKARLAFPQLVEVVEQLAATWSPVAVLIESKASGASLVQQLQQHSTLPVKAIQVDRDKVSRANACVPTWEAHRVFAPAGASWLQDFTDELFSFPKSVHDDVTDAFTQALLYSIQVKPGAGLLAWYEQQLAALKAEPNAAPSSDGTEPLRRPFWLMAERRGGKVSSL